MANSIFLLDNQADLGTVAASSTAGATMPAANVINEQRSKVWRSAAGATSYLNVSLGSAYGASYAAIIDVNLSTNGTIRVQSWSDALGGAVPGVDITVPASLYVSQDLIAAYYGNGPYGVGAYGNNGVITQSSGRNITLVSFGQITLNAFFRVTFTDSNTAYQQCGRLFIGRGVEFAKNLSYGWSARRVERTRRRESIGGQAYRQKRDSRLQIDGSFEWMTDAERTDFLIRMQDFGENKAFVYSVFPEGTNKGLTTTLYGRFGSAVLGNPGFERNSMQFSVIEEL